MSTQVKVITRDGLFGLVMHKHGNSAWHPANQSHTIRVGRTDRDNDEESHALHAALTPTDWGNCTDKHAYKAMVSSGAYQQPWHDNFLSKAKTRRASAREAAKDDLEELNEVMRG